jgi:hypothetical protein
MRERNSASLNSQDSRNGGERRQAERSRRAGLQGLVLMPNMGLCSFEVFLTRYTLYVIGGNFWQMHILGLI